MNSHANKYLSTISFLVKEKQLNLSFLFNFRWSWLSVRREYKYVKYMVWVFHLWAENRLGFTFYNLYCVYCNQTCSEQEACGTKYVFKMVNVTVRQVLCIKLVSSLVPLLYYKTAGDIFLPLSCLHQYFCA